MRGVAEDVILAIKIKVSVDTETKDDLYAIFTMGALIVTMGLLWTYGSFTMTNLLAFFGLYALGIGELGLGIHFCRWSYQRIRKKTKNVKRSCK